MKPLLLPLLAAHALPTAVNAGDLGIADFDLERLVNISKKNKIKYQEVTASDSIRFNCGAVGTNMKKCTIEFKHGLLIVDGSKGINPSQIKHLTFTNAPNYGLYIYMIYEDSNNKLVNAGFGSLDIREGAGFQTRFLNWMSEGK